MRTLIYLVSICALAACANNDARTADIYTRQQLATVQAPPTTPEQDKELERNHRMHGDKNYDNSTWSYKAFGSANGCGDGKRNCYVGYRRPYYGW